jgi:hypothetical protein
MCRTGRGHKDPSTSSTPTLELFVATNREAADDVSRVTDPPPVNTETSFNAPCARPPIVLRLRVAVAYMVCDLSDLEGVAAIHAPRARSVVSHRTLAIRGDWATALETFALVHLHRASLSSLSLSVPLCNALAAVGGCARTRA